jgi:hypothetical protein
MSLAAGEITDHCNIGFLKNIFAGKRTDCWQLPPAFGKHGASVPVAEQHILVPALCCLLLSALDVMVASLFHCCRSLLKK